MKKITHQILQELYALDPALRAHETALIQMIEQIQSARPKVVWDHTFYKTLHAQIRAQNHEPVPHFHFFSFMKTFTFATAVLLLIATPVVYQLFNQNTVTTDSTVKTQYVALDQNAFGPLLNFGDPDGLGGGGPPLTEKIKYNFTYSGDALDALPATFDVIASYEYSAEEIQQFLISKDLSDWYNDPNQTFAFGTLTLENPQADAILCSVFSCDENETTVRQFPPEDLLSDDEIFAIMNAFFTDHQLSTESIGTVYDPYVGQREDGTYTGMATINYEFLVNGKNIVGLYGDLILGVLNIDMGTEQVLDVSSFTPETYVTSAYDTAPITDILTTAEQGGLTLGAVENPDTTVNLHLGTPTMSYVQMVDSVAQKAYYVPAFVFPIVDKPDIESFWQDSVVVPLVSDMLDNLNQSY